MFLSLFFTSILCSTDFFFSSFFFGSSPVLTFFFSFFCLSCSCSVLVRTTAKMTTRHKTRKGLDLIVCENAHPLDAQLYVCESSFFIAFCPLFPPRFIAQLLVVALHRICQNRERLVKLFSRNCLLTAMPKRVCNQQQNRKKHSFFFYRFFF